MPMCEKSIVIWHSRWCIGRIHLGQITLEIERGGAKKWRGETEETHLILPLIYLWLLSPSHRLPPTSKFARPVGAGVINWRRSQLSDVENSPYFFLQIMCSDTGTCKRKVSKVAGQTLDCYCVCCELSASIADALLFVNILVSSIFHWCFTQQ